MRVGIVALGLILASSVEAAPRGLRLTYFDDPATTIAVSWNSDSATDSTIEYGTTTAYGLQATATVTPQPAPLNNSFTAKLTGLTPATTYHYRIGGVTGQFTTRDADICAPVRFILIGDNRQDTGDGSNPVWSDILVETLAHSPGFYVNTGDMVRDGANATQWSNFIEASAPGWANVPSILTMGNHDEDDVDGDGAMYNQLYEHPRNSATMTEDYYSIDVGPIHFVSLNSQFNNPSATELGQMATWLAADLAATTKPWKVVFFHKAIYSRGNHYSGEEHNGSLNATLIPIFDTHDVDFVFNGHSHNYERYVPTTGVDTTFGGGGRSFPAGTGGAVGSSLPDGTVGTTYMVSGGAGAMTTDLFGYTCQDAACTYCTGFNINCEDEVFDNDVDATVVYDGRHNFAVFDVVADTITVEVWTTAAQTGSTEDPELIDSFTVTKSSFPMCGVPPQPDAGVGGTIDAGNSQPGDDDAGGGGPGDPDATNGAAAPAAGGCGCSTTPAPGPAAPAALLLAALAFVRARRR